MIHSKNVITKRINVNKKGFPLKNEKVNSCRDFLYKEINILVKLIKQAFNLPVQNPPTLQKQQRTYNLRMA